jgi:hypothetical protein
VIRGEEENKTKKKPVLPAATAAFNSLFPVTII